MLEQRVALGERSYSIYIEKGLLRRIAEFVGRDFHPTKVCFVSDSQVSALYLKQLEEDFRRNSMEVCSFIVEAGEASKSMESLERLCTFLIEHQLDRNAMLVALGGGVVGDLTGFAASIYKRGIHYVQIPTSVVAQTDSSVGGKTAVDFGGVKNMLGTFHQPKAVYIDPEVLRTLPKRFLSDGLGEVVKYAVLVGGELYERVLALQNPDEFLQDDGFILGACIAYKRHLVETDERDTGDRMLLNLGHTLGHAIESFYQYQGYTHGEAVSVGLVEILSYAVSYHGMDPAIRDQVRSLLLRLRLPVSVEGDRKEIFTQIRQDKKCQGTQIRIALPKAPGQVFVTPVDLAHFTEEILHMSSREGDS